MKSPILTLSLIALLSGGIKNSYSQNSIFENSKLIIYGETEHMSEKQKEFVINSVDSLKEQGYNYLAIELPVECDSSIQHYLTSNKDYQDEKIKKLLEWWPSNLALNLAYNFHKKGFKVVPIDEGEDIINKITYKRYEGDSSSVELINERDKNMAKNIEKIFEKDSSAKVVAYNGAFHARETEEPVKIEKSWGTVFVSKYPTMAGILKIKGIDPETICLTEWPNVESGKYCDKTVYLK